MSRRVFVGGIAATSLVAALPGYPQPPSGQEASITAAQMRAGGATAKITTLAVRNDVKVLIGSGGNILVLPGPDGKLAIDSGFATSPAQIAEALAALSSEPLRHLSVRTDTSITPMATSGCTSRAPRSLLTRRRNQVVVASTQMSGSGQRKFRELIALCEQARVI
jgi:hypothetical protein